YKKMLEPLPPGTYQLIVHLAYDDEEMRGATWDHPNWGAAWRQQDLDLVKSQEFRDFLKDQHFTLTTWRELGKKPSPRSRLQGAAKETRTHGEKQIIVLLRASSASSVPPC